MEHFSGLDVSVKETSVCIVDGTGRMVREVKVASEPEALLAILTNPIYRFKRKHEPAGDIDTAAVDGLKALAPKRPIREAGLPGSSGGSDHGSRGSSRAVPRAVTAAASRVGSLYDATGRRSPV